MKNEMLKKQIIIKYIRGEIFTIENESKRNC